MPLNELLRVLTVLRELDQDMPIPQAICLLLIAKHEGLSLKELAEKAGVGMASASRYVAYFGKPHAGLGHKAGMGLVLAIEDPLERRKKTISLTTKGKALIHQLGA